MHAHVCVAAIPVQLQCDALADGRKRRTWRENVHDALAVAMARIDDRDETAVCATKAAGVTRLTAAHRVEDRAVELDAGIADRDDTRLAASEICVVPEQCVSHLIHLSRTVGAGSSRDRSSVRVA